VVAEWPKAHPC